MKLSTINFVLILCFLACGHDNSPKGVASEFLFRYFIELNQRGALEISTGLAAKKLQEEIELTQSVRMLPDFDLAQSKPFLDYELIKIQESTGATVTLFYDVTIENPGGKEYKREVVLTASKLNGNWKISNFDAFIFDTFIKEE